MTVDQHNRHRRRADGNRLLRPFTRLAIMPDGQLDAVSAGRLLLVAVGAVTNLTAPLLHPDERGWAFIAAVSLVMLSLLTATRFVPWDRLPQKASLAFPIAVCLAIVALSVGAPGLVAPLTGLLTLGFAYVGMTQSPRTCLILVPVAAATMLIANAAWNSAIVVRLIIGVTVWVLLAELLAGFTRRQAALTAALSKAAYTDALTGIANRRDLQSRMSLASIGDAMVVCDLDHFKRLNDTFGHEAGDKVLADFGSMLRTTLRHNDYCARYGGEEFALLLPSTSLAEARSVVDRLQRHWALLQPSVTFSAGIALCRTSRSTAETFSAADGALYRAKAAGRNTTRTELSPVVDEPSNR
jgi:diguanylate cyclase (GGDEF)-like protein